MAIEARFIPDTRTEHAPGTRVFIKPGVGESKSIFKKFSRALSEKGHTVYTDERGPQKSDKELRGLYSETVARAREWYTAHPPQNISAERLEALFLSVPLTLFQDVLSYSELIRQGKNDDDRTVAVGHSKGAMVATLTAFLMPELFPNTDPSSTLILMNPLGFTGKKEIHKSKELRVSQKILRSYLASFQEAVGNVGRELKIMSDFVFTGLKSISRNQNMSVLRAVGSGFGEIVMNWAKLSSRTEREAYEMANVDIIPFLEVLNANGLRVAVLYDEHDSLFKARRIEGRVDSTHAYIELHKTTHGGHYAPLKQATRIAEEVDIIIS